MYERLIISLEVHPSTSPGYEIKLYQRDHDDSFHVKCSASGGSVLYYLARRAQEERRNSGKGQSPITEVSSQPDQAPQVSKTEKHRRVPFPQEMTWRREVEEAAGSAIFKLVYETPVSIIPEPKRDGWADEMVGGTYYEARIEQAHGAAYFCWHTVAPAKWSHLEEVVQRLKAAAELDEVLAPVIEGARPLPE